MNKELRFTLFSLFGVLAISGFMIMFAVKAHKYKENYEAALAGMLEVGRIGIEVSTDLKLEVDRLTSELQESKERADAYAYLCSTMREQIAV